MHTKIRNFDLQGKNEADYNIADMEKGANTWTLSAEIFQNCGNFWIVED